MAGVRDAPARFIDGSSFEETQLVH